MKNAHQENFCIEAGILENALVMIMVLDKKGKVVSWNHSAETVTGYSREDVVGSSAIWKSLYPDKEYRESVTKKIAGILSTHKFFENLETTIRSKTGESRIILWNTKEIEVGNVPRIITVGLDITEQRKADQFRTGIIDNANILIAVLDTGKVRVWNDAAENITGYTRKEVLQKRDIWKWLYPDENYRRMVTRRIIDIIRADRYFENLETAIVTKSGEKKNISWNTRRIGEGALQQDIVVGLDITARKQAEDALLAYMTEMAMRLRAPVEIIRDNLIDVAALIRDKKLEPEEIALILDGQIRNANQVNQNIMEFQRAITEKNKEIPEAYRKFLEGE
jgi:PAS domain S-box-containing protein